MAVPRLARLTSTTSVGPDTRLLEFQLLGGEPLGFVGGQYIIVDSGLLLPSGKAAKRAYSLLSCDDEQAAFQTAVKRMPDGPVSSFLHEAKVGAEIRFSGPWGKLHPAEGATGRTLVLATDTGITAALGLLQSRGYGSLLATTTFIWLRTTPDYFLPDPLVRAKLPSNLASVEIKPLPPVNHPERVPWVRSLLRDLVQPGHLAQAFVAGDGTVNYAVLDDLIAVGVPATRDSVESFFNSPKKSVP